MTLARKAAESYLCFNVPQPGEKDRCLISDAMLHTVSRGLELFWALSLSLISQFFVSTIKIATVTESDFRLEVFIIKARHVNRDLQLIWKRKYTTTKTGIKCQVFQWGWSKKILSPGLENFEKGSIQSTKRN